MYIQIGFEEYFHLSSLNNFDDLIDQLNDLFGENTYIIEKNGKKIDLCNEHQLIEDETYKIWPKVLGGKGGFGSLLRSFGKQILISKNKEACRDLNGRRMRDVNNEKKLKEWMQKQLEKPSIEHKSTASSSNEEKNDYRNVPPPHKFSDTAYDEQKKQIADDMDEAIQIGAEYIQAEKMKRKKKSPTAVSTNDNDDDDDDDDDNEKGKKTKKRRHSNDTLEDGEVKNKKTKKEKGANAAFFLGIDIDDLSSDDDDDDKNTHEKDAKKKKSIK